MSFTKESATEKAKRDLAERLQVDVNSIKELSIKDRDFPDMSLGASEDGEMSAQMISTGWKINLNAKGKDYEYRADKYQLRLKGSDGNNYVIVS